jgi:hypothetical protein
MSANGQLVFTDVDKITFKGVGNASNAVIDTLTGKIGVGIDSPEANLHVVGNSYVSTNLELGGTLIMGTVNVEAQHSLEAVTATGNTTPLTIEFTNPTTSLVASGNVEVGGNVVAGYLYGDGSNISGISSNLDQIVNIGNVTSNTVQFTNPTTSLVASGNVEVGGELTVSGNATVSSNLTVSENLTVGGDLDISGNLGSSLVNLVYPIGAVYISVNSADPGTIWAGTTWVAFGEGRTLVGQGQGSGLTNRPTVEATGGAETHTLTVAQIPAHNHTFSDKVRSMSTQGGYPNPTAQYNPNIATNDISNTTNNRGGGEAHNNMQPFIVTYMWKRTA